MRGDCVGKSSIDKCSINGFATISWVDWCYSVGVGLTEPKEFAFWCSGSGAGAGAGAVSSRARVMACLSQRN